MEREVEKIIKDAQKIRLTSEESFAIKKQILSHIEKNPIKTSKFTSEVFFGFLNLRSVYLVPLAVIIFVSGGVGYMASNSLPGSMLYPVKINVNENIESLVAVTPESQAEVDLRQVGVRLNEADTLAINGDLTDIKSQVIVTNLTKNVNSLNKNIDKVEKKGESETAQKVAKNFETKIEEHLNTFVSLFNSKKMADKESFGEPPVATTMAMDAGTATKMTFSANMAMATASEYKISEIKKHKTSDDCWTVISGDIFDLTEWIKQNPKDKSRLKKMCGIDGSRVFKNQFGNREGYIENFIDFKIGILIK